VHDLNGNGRDEIIAVQQSGIGSIPMVFEYYNGAFKQTLTYEDPSRTYAGIEPLGTGELRIYGYGEPRDEDVPGYSWYHYRWNEDIREYEIIETGKTSDYTREWLGAETG
jgi:hypothetical protein